MVPTDDCLRIVNSNSSSHSSSSSRCPIRSPVREQAIARSLAVPIRFELAFVRKTSSKSAASPMAEVDQTFYGISQAERSSYRSRGRSGLMCCQRISSSINRRTYTATATIPRTHAAQRAVHQCPGCRLRENPRNLQVRGAL